MSRVGFSMLTASGRTPEARCPQDDLLRLAHHPREGPSHPALIGNIVIHALFCYRPHVLNLLLSPSQGLWIMFSFRRPPPEGPPSPCTVGQVVRGQTARCPRTAACRRQAALEDSGPGSGGLGGNQDGPQCFLGHVSVTQASASRLPGCGRRPSSSSPHPSEFMTHLWNIRVFLWKISKLHNSRENRVTDSHGPLPSSDTVTAGSRSCVPCCGATLKHTSHHSVHPHTSVSISK